MRKLISGGTIYDGTGSTPYTADILIEGDRIEKIGWFPHAKVDEIINAEGMAVTPGFIDSHRHSDIAAIVDPSFGDIELAQGISTTLSGNCGLAPVPSEGQTRKQLYDFIEPCLGAAPSDLKLDGFKDYLDALEAVHPYINIGGMVATGAVKIAAKGFDKTPFTASEMERAQRYIIEAMEAGAFGISTGIMYTPECYSTGEEFIKLLSPAAKYGRVLTCHIRGEGDILVSSVEEVIEIAKKAELPLNISHFKAVGCKNWSNSIFRAIEKIETARARGQDVTVDFYPYTGGSTTLMSLIPPECVMPDIEDTLRALSTREGINKLRAALAYPHENWDNMVLAIGWERIIISSVTKQSNRQYQGRSIHDICESLGCKDEVEFISNLLVDEQGKVGIIIMSMSQADLDVVAKLPYSMVISDALYGAAECPHPRLYGSFSKIIREYVIERSLLSMECAVNKMTGMTAERFKIPYRGKIKEGNYGDLNIFIPELVMDHAKFGDSKQISTGMDVVLIGGEVVWKNNQRTNKHTAQVLIAKNKREGEK